MVDYQSIAFARHRDPAPDCYLCPVQAAGFVVKVPLPLLPWYQHNKFFGEREQKPFFGEFNALNLTVDKCIASGRFDHRNRPGTVVV